jgi:pyrroline-5-carboxylate reductase
MTAELGLSWASDNTTPGACPHVLLAVKPQVVGRVLEEIKPVVSADATIISIAAGVTTSFIDEKLGGKGHIVRVMPNTPLLVGAGVSAISPGPRAGDDDIDWTRRLFDAGGMTVTMPEDKMDAVTALSGSGPAYLYYLIEAMAAAGASEGIDPDIAETLAAQTCIGAGKLLAETKKSSAQLRRQVTTPNGTTQRAIETLDAAGVKEKIIEAVRNAAQRSRELGQ